MRVLRGEQKTETDAQLESLLLQGLESGKDAPDNQEFWREVKSEAAQICSQKEAGSQAAAVWPVKVSIGPSARDDK